MTFAACGLYCVPALRPGVQVLIPVRLARRVMMSLANARRNFADCMDEFRTMNRGSEHIASRLNQLQRANLGK